MAISDFPCSTFCSLEKKSGEDVKKVRFRMGEKEDGRGDSRTQFVTRGEEGGIKTFFF